MQCLALRRQVAGRLIGVNGFREIRHLHCLMPAPGLQGDASWHGEAGFAQRLPGIGCAFLPDQRIGQDNPGVLLLRVTRLSQQCLARRSLGFQQGASGQQAFRALGTKFRLIRPKRHRPSGQGRGFVELARLPKPCQRGLGLRGFFKLRKSSCHYAPQASGVVQAR